MALNDLNQMFSIVDPTTGKPTDYLMRLLRDRGQDVQDLETIVTTLVEDVEILTTTVDSIDGTVFNAGTGLDGGGVLGTDDPIEFELEPLTPSPAGTFTSADITVDAYGRVTLAASGSGGSGTVSSVNASGGTTGLTFTGGPITTTGTLTLGGTLAVANGGTGATTASTARSNLGAAASGAVGSSGLTMTTARILGRTTASTGAIEEITVGTGLTLSAGSLVATGVPLPANSWRLAASWDYSVAVANVDLTWTEDYNDLIIIARNLTTSVANTRHIQLSTDGGTTFISSYDNITNLGVESVNSFAAQATSSSAAARGMAMEMLGAGISGLSDRLIIGPQDGIRSLSSNTGKINAARIAPGGGNLTGGLIRIYVR